jgi:hypothetical protein
MKMPLPALIRAEFEYVDPQTTQENDHYGAYNILLCHAFPTTEGYVVHPQVIQVRTSLLSKFSKKLTDSQVAPATSSLDALDFVVYFRVYFHRIPVLFLQVKTAVTIANLSSRAAVDDQIRLRLRQLFDECLSELHGISALGTRLCFYCLDKNTESLTPPFIPRNPACVNDVAPTYLWDTDILTDDGYNHFMGIVQRTVRTKALSVDEGVGVRTVP